MSSLALRPFQSDDIDDYNLIRTRVHHGTATADEKRTYLESLPYLYNQISQRSRNIQRALVETYKPVVDKYANVRARIQELLPVLEVETYMNYDFTLQKLEYDMEHFAVRFHHADYGQMAEWLKEVNQLVPESQVIDVVGDHLDKKSIVAKMLDFGKQSEPEIPPVLPTNSSQEALLSADASPTEERRGEYVKQYGARMDRPNASSTGRGKNGEEGCVVS